MYFKSKFVIKSEHEKTASVRFSWVSLKVVWCASASNNLTCYVVNVHLELGLPLFKLLSSSRSLRRYNSLSRLYKLSFIIINSHRESLHTISYQFSRILDNIVRS